MSKKAVFGIDLRSFGSLGQALDTVAGRVQSIGKTFGRLASQKGGTTAGGGRGVFAGTLKDFATRDEFVGRAGTIGRGLMAGRLGGVFLAAVSVEEFFRNAVQLLRGDKEFRQIMKDQMAFLIPSILKDALPALIEEYAGDIPFLELGRGRTAKAEALGQIELEMRRLKRLYSFRDDTESTRELLRNEARRWANESGHSHDFIEGNSAGAQ